MLFQNYALFPHLTVSQNIAYPLKLRKLKKDDIDKKVKHMIELIKLAGLEDRYPRQLSGGQQQRVALARAIIYNPPLLLLDEPLGALDKNLRHDMQFEIKRITHKLGMTTISVTHDQEEAFSMSDKICIVSGGQIQQFDTPENIYEKPANRFVAEFMGTTNIIPMNDATYEAKGDKTTVTGTSPLTQGKCVLRSDSNAVKATDKNPFFALRPEDIHLKTDSNAHENTFKAKLVEIIYLGQYVKAKAQAGNLSLNVTLDVREFRNLNPDMSCEFSFSPEHTAIIYN